jgi:Mn-containing catalase
MAAARRHTKRRRANNPQQRERNKEYMSQLKELLTEEMQDLLHAEMQLTKALPKMAEAAHNPKLRELFEKHLVQTQGQVERLKEAFAALGEKAEPKPCKAMAGLIAEGEETIEEGSDKPEQAADLALITAAQKVEHYEISGYGSLRSLARQIGEFKVYELLSHTLGEEESADFLLSEVSKPIIQQAVSETMEKLTGKKQTAGV